MHGIGKGDHPAGLQDAEAVIDHVLTRFSWELVHQENAGHPLEGALGEGHGFAIALHQLGKLPRELAQPLIGLAQVGTGEIQAHQLGFGQGPSDLPEGAARAGGHIQHPDLASRTPSKGPQPPNQGSDHPAAHGICRAVEQDFNLKVVERR